MCVKWSGGEGKCFKWATLRCLRNCVSFYGFYFIIFPITIYGFHTINHENGVNFLSVFFFSFSFPKHSSNALWDFHVIFCYWWNFYWREWDLKGFKSHSLFFCHFLEHSIENRSKFTLTWTIFFFLYIIDQSIQKKSI